MQKTIQRRAELKRIPLRRVSKKRASQLREYFQSRALYLVAHPICEVWLREHGFVRFSDGYSCVITEPRWSADALVMTLGAPLATEIHHMKGRTHDRLNDERFWIAVSRKAHEWIHANPSKARKLGVLI